MQLKNVLTLSATSMAFLLMVGCAKNYVQENVAVVNTNMPKPSSVLIYNFAVNPEDVKTTSGILGKIETSMKKTTQSAEEQQIAREVSDAMATELTQKIAAMGLNPVRATDSLRPTQGSIVITGAFVNIDEGNQARRSVVGLGMGQSSLDSKVVVLAPSASGDQELLSFDAHADSGDMPGAAVMGPAGAAAGAGTAAIVATNVATGAVKSYKSASAQQAKKMAENIAAQLATYFAQQGWINPQ
jgi:hypothetical protein